MAKNNETSALDEEKMLMDIEKFGWTIILIEGTDYLPTFAYTIGLYKNFHHPEVIIFGLDTDTLFETLNTIGEDIKAGATFTSGKNYPELFEDSRTEFIKVDPENVEDYFGYAVDYYEEHKFAALELIWTDENNAFPWDKKYNRDFQFSQPLLDRNMTFKFMEERNLNVFVAYQFLENGALITKVVHDTEGDWYFHTIDSRASDLGNTTLEQIVRADSTLNDLFSLDYEEQAIRGSRDEVWIRSIAQKKKMRE
jgi:hypothetical protein